MFKACFVARVEPAESSINIFCQFRNEELGTSTDLPNAQNLGKFCFPLGPEQVKPREYCAPEEYSFTLTGGDGSHLHGFCRCFLPPRSREVEPKRKNANLRYPQVLCIISPFPWFPFYFKVLQITEALLKRQDLLVKCSEAVLPESSAAAQFLTALLRACKGKPELGRIIKVPLPDGRTNVSPQRRIPGLEYRHDRPLQSTDKFVELQIPPDTGNGSWNAGIPLARLFWHLPSAPLMALIQALLLERRVVMVAQERDTLSAGLHAAAALLYPFRWQHIYLPYLPHSLKDYLTAPMPYLIGIPSPQLLRGLEHMGLEEVVFVDLDAGTCRLGSQDGPDMDSALLPWSHHLQAAFQVVYQMLRSPTEFESTPVIGHCMQEYFLKLLAGYREFIELDVPEEPAKVNEQAPPPGVRQQVQDDGYLRAHGFRFDHLSFVANQRRSEKARNFLDLLRHSQLYEVFINERLALAAADYKTSDAFEAKVEYMLSKKGKVLGRLVAQASARGVSNLSAVLQRTSTLVKSGVSQIRHAQPFSDHLESGSKTPQPQETIVPSYSIDIESPKKRQKAAEEHSPPASLPPAVPNKNEDPTAFFNHQDDSDEDVAPEPPPSQAMSPIRQRMSQNSLGGINPVKSGGSELTSPRATGITSGGEGFDNLLNLDGVDGVFGQQSTTETRPNKHLSINLSLLDEDGDGQMDSGGRSFDLSSWGLGLPSVSEAASSVANWASSVQDSVQAMAQSIAGNETPPSQIQTAPQTISGGRTPTQSYDLTHANSLGTINAFGDFRSPEAVRAASSTKSIRTPGASSFAETPTDQRPPIPESSPAVASRGWASQPSTSQKKLNAGTSTIAAGIGKSAFQRSGSASLDERIAEDPFSALDPIMRPTVKTPMSHSRGYKSADAGPASCKQEPGEMPCNFSKLTLDSNQRERSSLDSNTTSGSPMKVSTTSKEADGKTGGSLLDS